jgi:tellurite resistance protein TerC
MTIKKALLWVSFWVSLSLLFNAGVWIFEGHQKALEFFGGYVIEMSLSMDNLFVFLLIFSSFSIPSDYQRRALNYGIIGAVILRFVFIMLGVAVVNQFEWVLYIFGALLLFSGYKMFFQDEEEKKDFSDSTLLKLLGKIIPVTPTLEKQRFFVKKEHILYATPLFAVLVLVEGSDIIFAIDSIPAIFSITRDPFIIYTSNICAILGLRSLYFVLERLHHLFRFVKYGVALILTFTGVKLMVLMFHWKIDLLLSVLIIFSLLFLSILFSIWFPEKKHNHSKKAAPEI